MDVKFLSKGIGYDETIKHAEIAKQCKVGIIEIGVLNGDNSKILAENTKVQVWGIDPIIRHPTLIHYIGSEDKIRENLSGCPNFTFIKDYSYNVIKTFNHEVDYLFIDGSHDYPDVKKDYEDWFSKVIQGGIIAFHDSAMFRGGPAWWEGSSRFVDEILYDSKLEYLETIFSMTIFRKR